MAASYHPATRSAELENFRLVGPTGRFYSIESFPTGSVLAIYFGYTTCLRACPNALNDLTKAIDRLGKLGASIQAVFIDLDPDLTALVSLPAYMRLSGKASWVSPVRPTTSSRQPRALRSGLSAPLLVPTRPIM
jgi:cytochrome oxidase Cu insertion factor (SCO1/SenC/PrrC family)